MLSEYPCLPFDSVIEKRPLREIDRTADRATLWIQRTKDQTSDTGMQDRADAHHTRFERHVKRCIDQSVIAQGITGRPQCNNFRVRGWITSFNGAIPPFRDQRLVTNNNRTHRYFTQSFGFVRQTNGMPHPLFIKPWHKSS